MLPTIEYSPSELVILEKVLRHAKQQYIITDDRAADSVLNELTDCYKWQELLLSAHDKVVNEVMKGSKGREQGAESLK